jgi:hypothetical protein
MRQLLYCLRETKTVSETKAVATHEVGGWYRAFAGGGLETFGQRGAGSEDPRTTEEFEDFERVVSSCDKEAVLGVEDGARGGTYPDVIRRNPHLATASSEQPALSRHGGSLTQRERVDGNAVDVQAEWFGVLADADKKLPRRQVDPALIGVLQGGNHVTNSSSPTGSSALVPN